MISNIIHTPSAQCHASTIVETDIGFIVAWLGGRFTGSRQSGIWMTQIVDSGQYSLPIEVATGCGFGDICYPCYNPVLFRGSDNTLFLFYKVGESPVNWWGMLLTSRDHGKTWGKPQKLGENRSGGHLIGPVKNKPVLLETGAILSPCSRQDKGWQVFFEISTDLGQTWQVTTPVADTNKFGAIQPSILKHPDGRLQILCRSRKKIIVQSWTEDGGKNWSCLEPTAIQNPNSGIDAVTLFDGRHILVYNDSALLRTPLCVAISSDGLDWKKVLTLEDTEGIFSYPSIIQASNGMLHITYTYLKEGIKHVIVDPEIF